MLKNNDEDYNKNITKIQNEIEKNNKNLSKIANYIDNISIKNEINYEKNNN